MFQPWEVKNRRGRTTTIFQTDKEEGQVQYSCFFFCIPLAFPYLPLLFLPLSISLILQSLAAAPPCSTSHLYPITPLHLAVFLPSSTCLSLSLPFTYNLSPPIAVPPFSVLSPVSLPLFSTTALPLPLPCCLSLPA